MKELETWSTVVAVTVVPWRTSWSTLFGFSTIAWVTPGSRMIFPFSPDRAVHIPALWRKVAPNRVPVNAVTAISVLAWALAWPLTQFGLLLQPRLLHYGGLSGVLHAGVAVVACHLVFAGGAMRRTLGLAIVGGLALKVIAEAPWTGPLRHVRGGDVGIAPAAHASGLLAGLFCGLAAELIRRQRPSGTGTHHG